MADSKTGAGEIKQKVTKKLFWGLGCLGIGIIAGIVFLSWKNGRWQLLNPLSKNQVKQAEKKTGQVVGFLPTWMVGKTKLYGQELDELIFLGVEVKEDGSLVWDGQSKKLNSDDFIKLKESVNKSGGKNILGIKLFDDEKIEALLASEEAKQRLFTEVRDVLVAGNLAGVNIDFEYMSNPTKVLDDDFGGFLEGVKQAGWGEVSLDVFANTIIKGSSDGLKKMMEKVDKVIVMAYDFHRPGSDYAGAVAPMGAEAGKRSISEIFQKIVDFGLNKEQFILAYPLYGYEWETETNLLNSATRTVGYGKTVFFSDAASDPPWGVSVEPKWDEMAQSPWTAWQESVKRSKVTSYKVGKKTYKKNTYYYVNQWHQAYFENEESLRIKAEAAKQAQVGGIGFWALGYEGTESNIISNLKFLISN